MYWAAWSAAKHAGIVPTAPLSLTRVPHTRRLQDGFSRVDVDGDNYAAIQKAYANARINTSIPVRYSNYRLAGRRRVPAAFHLWAP